ncbi:MAG: hypothetical protein QGF57_05700, partial [Candidatus Marinimicrobia bacterium]|nr:hypothetical protein [Candidatus Neomarinimicrobiota bacterium]
MKQLFTLFTALLLLTSTGYSIAGFGLNLNQSLYGVGADIDTVGTVSFGNKEFSNGIGFGGYFYVDAIPFIDVDLEFNGFASEYDYEFMVGNQITNYSLPFGSLSGYLTIQKKLFQLKIPLLAKAKLTAGAGINSQTYKSTPSQKDLESLLGLEDG